MAETNGYGVLLETCVSSFNEKLVRERVTLCLCGEVVHTLFIDVIYSLRIWSKLCRRIFFPTVT
jgi:hypothetical protein